MNFMRKMKKGSSKSESAKEASLSKDAANTQNETESKDEAIPVEATVEFNVVEKEETSEIDLPKYVCICTNGSSYKSEPAFHSPNVGMIRAFGRVQPLKMLDEKGNPTEHHEKYAWMEVDFENERVFLPIHTIDGDILFQPHQPTYGAKSETMELFQKKKNETTPQIFENDHEDDGSSASSDSFSSVSDDEDHPNVPRGEDLGLSGDELSGYRFLTKMGFEKFYPKFRDAKCCRLAEMIDPTCTTDALLQAGIGFSSIQISVFRLEVMNHQNSDHDHHHHAEHHKHDESLGRGSKGGKEGDWLDQEEEVEEAEEEEDETNEVVREKRKSALLMFTSQLTEEASKPSEPSVGKSKWKILRKRITEAKDGMIAKSVVERAEMRRATKQADDLSKMFSSMNFNVPLDPPPNPSPLRVRSLSISELDLLKRPCFVSNDVRARTAALERAEQRSQLIKPRKLTATINIPPGDSGGFVWTDGGFIIHIHKGSFVQRSGRVTTGWRLGSINDVSIPVNASYTLVKSRLNAVKTSNKSYTLTFEPPDKKGTKRLSDLGTAL